MAVALVPFIPSPSAVMVFNRQGGEGVGGWEGDSRCYPEEGCQPPAPSQWPGPCLTTATWRCRKNFSQWECSFHWKLRYHWLEFLRQRQIAVVRQGPEMRKFKHYVPCSFKWYNMSKFNFLFYFSCCNFSHLTLKWNRMVFCDNQLPICGIRIYILYSMRE